ncbi:type II toxin-antitoxin system antitoxin DNA ADP-ribosyl glycohydrolase DarG [Segnochrobactraceae bacterium EtOH-i3]
MFQFAQGNLLDADVDAVVNTVNTVGVMGKGIALMFKEKFPENFSIYERACKEGEVRIGKMLVTENTHLFGPRWIINFPTKTHWRAKTHINWIEQGLESLKKIIIEYNIRSIAIPPLGCGNGGLNWNDVRPRIISSLSSLQDIDIYIYEPTPKYLNVSKRSGVEKLTPARALIVEMVRRYSLLGIDCSIIEVQKLGWFLERGIHRFNLDDPLNFKFSAAKYGPYSYNLIKLLDSLDGSYLQCDKRLADATPLDLISFKEEKFDRVQTYLNSSEIKKYIPALEWASEVIDGFESPLGMELLATIDWMIERQNTSPTTTDIINGLHSWPAGEEAGQRKIRLFKEHLVEIALAQIEKSTAVLP